MQIICEGNEIILELSENQKVLKSNYKSGNITQIIINEELERIEDNALSGNKIKKLDLKNVKYIGRSSFENNNILGVLIIPESVEYIGNLAFANNRIKEVIIENPNTVIEEDAFLNNNDIKIRYKQPSKGLFLSFRKYNLKKDIVN